MRSLTPAEKLKYIGTNSDTARPKVDLRKRISEKLEQNGIPKVRAAEYLGISSQNLYNYLNGRIPMRIEYIEQLLWLLESDNCLVEEGVYNQLMK